MTHYDEDQLLAFGLGTLPDDRIAVEINDHLTGCDLCRSKLNAIHKSIGIISSIKPIMTSINNHRVGKMRGKVMPTLKAAALLLIGLIIGYAAANSTHRPGICVSGMYMSRQAPADSLAGCAIADAVAVTPLP